MPTVAQLSEPARRLRDRLASEGRSAAYDRLADYVTELACSGLDPEAIAERFTLAMDSQDDDESIGFGDTVELLAVVRDLADATTATTATTTVAAG